MVYYHRLFCCFVYICGIFSLLLIYLEIYIENKEVYILLKRTNYIFFFNRKMTNKITKKDVLNEE